MKKEYKDCLNKSIVRNPKIIVSLTSYGRRVKDVLPYTLISLMRQTLKPDKIILWLDCEKWNEEQLPEKIKKMQLWGVDIRFCTDIKSYTKLLPALKEFPDDLIITVDDDIYYSKYLIEDLYKSYLLDPQMIHCKLASMPLLSSDKKKLKSYKLWKNINEDFFSSIIFALGFCGILYPPNSLYPDVVNEELFKKLCPTADDVWFWGMSIMQNTKKKVVPLKKGQMNYSFDALYQYFHKGTALAHQNVKEDCKNDEQIKKLIDYYQLIPMICNEHID